jgi:hypothetical protein
LNILTQGAKKPDVKYIVFLAIPLVLSAYTHLWNIIGFPSIHIDESHYMRRAMLVISNLGPQDPYYPYDHPYFGQIFLAGILGMIGYPNSLNLSPNGDVHSIEMLYLIPRLLMGILAIVDTFLVYKIAEYRHGRNVALASSVVFAVMPLSWLLRRIYLDSILLPFLLSSILLAVYLKKLSDRDSNNSIKDNKLDIKIPILLSGILLGLAIYTKIPAFTMIPLVGFLVHKNSNKSWKLLGLWFIPVILIPLMWPAYSISVGQFDEWKSGLLHQTNREGVSVLESVRNISGIDPVLLTLGTIGCIIAAIRKDFFCLIWILPFAVFSAAIGYVQYFHVILILPAFCIGIGILIEIISRSITKKKTLQKFLILASISAIGIFGLVSTSIIISTNVNSSFFSIYSFITTHLLQANDISDSGDKINIIGNHWWSYNTLWIPMYVLHDNVEFNKPYEAKNILKKSATSSKILIIADQPLVESVQNRLDNTGKSSTQARNLGALASAFNLTRKIGSFTDTVNPFNFTDYPYTSLLNMIQNENRPIGKIDIRMNY